MTVDDRVNALGAVRAAIKQACTHAARWCPHFEPSPDDGRGRAACVPSALRRVGAGQGAAMLLVVSTETTSRETFLSPRTTRVTVIDPLPRWLVPLSKTLCRFIVSMRLLGLLASASRSHAFGPAQLERYESEFLRGYFDDDATSIAGVRAYQLLICSTGGRLRQVQVDAGSGRWFDRYFHREATCLLVLLDQLSGPSSHSAPGRLR